MYFSGFCFKDEKELFKEYLQDGDFIVSGFSYGAIKALQYTIQQIQNNKRVDKLQLFSPAYFVHQDNKYKRLQLMFFKKDKDNYINNFIKNLSYPKDIYLTQYITNGTYQQLDELLHYSWDKTNLQLLLNNNVQIEVFIGANDKIIDANLTKDFFKEFGEVYYIKRCGHIL